MEEGGEDSDDDSGDLPAGLRGVKVHLLGGEHCLLDSGLKRKSMSKFRGLFDKVYVGCGSSTTLALRSEGEVLKTFLKTGGVLMVESFKNHAQLDHRTKLAFRVKVAEVLTGDLGFTELKGSNALYNGDFKDMSSKDLALAEQQLNTFMQFEKMCSE